MALVRDLKQPTTVGSGGKDSTGLGNVQGKAGGPRECPHDETINDAAAIIKRGQPINGGGCAP
jgi:hypothetical protein